uniref:PqiC family protein n=1 Tax=Ningiella ruwaisensis TaxID=2364274 RepID=UPI00109FDA02|nr:ABC-type transport auxiliary lipoprotein family protein [Ningiella ruwaisensis]
MTISRKRNITAIAIYIASAIAASGCTSSAPAPQMQHYILDSAADRLAMTAKVQKVDVRIASIPDYLNTNNLVMQTEDHQMVLARYHAWANRLSDSIASIVAFEVNEQVAGKEWADDCVACQDIALHIEHFYPTSQGDVFLVGHFEYSGLNKEKQRIRFSYAGEMEAGGYASAVKEMRALLLQLSGQISESLASAH